ncbi:hypothetical protein HMPREF1544_08611 [Mucor circinelloides 1006PhL]|uniref:PHD-type domain-containing protein n=1 Tax=Mucor circinelloides f. circinelloides (strain 1006PhL) TaxID=1220926 RepID=S2J4M0_MUCC1|nr:hypothetical protein HMPREF1544_08611 [Mucor circinelloides 1006PhL]
MSEQVEHLEHNGSNSSSNRLPLRKRISPVLKWQPVETPEEIQQTSYPSQAQLQQPYPIQNSLDHLVSDGAGNTMELDQEKNSLLSSSTTVSQEPHLFPPQPQSQTTVAEATTTAAPSSSSSVSMATTSKRNIEKDDSRPVKKVKRGRPPLHKNTNNNNTTSEPATPSTPTTPPNQQQAQQRPPNDNNNELYCICKRPYDVKEFMIACDKCNEWFHGECIEISEKQSEFIDLYYCANCAKLTGKKTLWKPNCANPACIKPARIGTVQGHESKYCSDTCGMQVARARIELAELKKRNATMSLEEQPYNPLSRARLSSFADMDDRARLNKVKEEKVHAKALITMVEHKSTLLKLLIQQSDEEMCGFDSRLTWPDTIWEKVDQVRDNDQHTISLLDANNSHVSSKGFTKCSQSRKCTKHLNWQKTKTAELEQERSEQFIILTMLERERQQIKARMKKRREEVDLVDYLENGTISHF